MGQVQKNPFGSPEKSQRKGDKPFMYAIVEAGGKQYRVTPGDVVKIDHLQLSEGEPFRLEKVLFVQKDDATVAVGTPFVQGASVRGTVLAHGKDQKVMVFRYRRKKNIRKFRGHRQQFTQVKIEGIDIE
jgi:large subunit ribosomal protein L21